MKTTGFTLFDTAVGRCGIVWNDSTILGVQLPEADDAVTRSRLLRKVLDVADAADTAPPAHVQPVIDDIVALLNGDVRNFSDVALDMDGVSAFNRKVYDVAQTIPPGDTLTYGQVAARIGEPGAARAVGKALGENPWPIVVPCHRVLAAGGKTGGFSAPGGIDTKLRMLSIERVHSSAPPSLFDDDPNFDYQARS